MAKENYFAGFLNEIEFVVIFRLIIRMCGIENCFKAA